MSVTFGMSDDQIFNAARLQAVYATELLDTPPESAFDDLTAMAARLVHAPFAFATLVDDVRAYWKSSYGLAPDAPTENSVDEAFCQYVVRTGKQLIVPDTLLDERTKDNPSIQKMGVRAWAGFPVFSPGGHVLGSFCAVDVQAREWSSDDVALLGLFAQAVSREIGLRMALSDERTARLRANTLVHALQESLLPPSLPIIPGLDLAACFQAAGTGEELVGDFYDAVYSKRELLHFVIGDVCGKGIIAARVATFARHVINAEFSFDDGGPSHILERLNAALIRNSRAQDRFLTAICGSIRREAEGMVMRVAAAGHVPLLIRRADGSIERLAEPGMLIGIWDTFSVPETKRILHSGDIVIGYTDGVIEARCGDDFYGETRLAEFVAGRHHASSANSIAESLRDEVLAFSQHILRDDIAIVVIRVP